MYVWGLITPLQGCYGDIGRTKFLGSNLSHVDSEERHCNLEVKIAQEIVNGKSRGKERQKMIRDVAKYLYIQKMKT